MRRIILPALVLLAGCSVAAIQALDVLDPRPTASVETVRIEDIGLDALTLGFTIDVQNPYSFDLPLVDLQFALRTNGQAFLDGTTEVGGSVPARGHRRVTLPVGVNYRGLMDTAQDIRPGQVVPWTASLGLKVRIHEADLLVPVEHSGEMPIPKVPTVDVGSIGWDELSLDAVRGTLELELGNPNDFPFTLSGLDYDLSLADRHVALGEADPGLALEPGASGTLQIPLAFAPTDAGLALLNVLRGDRADYALGGSLRLQTPFGPMDLPFRRTGTVDQTR